MPLNTHGLIIPESGDHVNVHGIAIDQIVVNSNNGVGGTEVWRKATMQPGSQWWVPVIRNITNNAFTCLGMKNLNCSVEWTMEVSGSMTFMCDRRMLDNWGNKIGSSPSGASSAGDLTAYVNNVAIFTTSTSGERMRTITVTAGDRVKVTKTGTRNNRSCYFRVQHNGQLRVSDIQYSGDWSLSPLPNLPAGSQAARVATVPASSPFLLPNPIG